MEEERESWRLPCDCSVCIKADVGPEFFRPSTSSILIYYLSQLKLGFLGLNNQSLLTYKAFLVGKPSAKARRENRPLLPATEVRRGAQVTERGKPFERC